MGSAVGGGVLMLFLILLVFYFLPTAIALMRQHKDAPAIAAINILLGWSVVGWLVSFIWALSDPSGRRGTQTVVINTTQNNAPVAPDPRIEPPRPTTPPPRTQEVVATPDRHALEAPDRDTAFWDGLKDKSNPDDLEEYLVRFPNGKFADLARARLERKGIAPPPAIAAISAPAPAAKPVEAPTEPPPAPAKSTLLYCTDCGGRIEPDVRFCDGCGASIAA